MKARAGCSLPTALAVLAACSGAPKEVEASSFDQSGGYVEVEVLGDGFVRSGGRRIPLEAMVLELRQATRAMAKEQLDRFVVRLQLAGGIADEATAAVARRDLNRLIDQLDIMEVGQVKFL